MDVSTHSDAAAPSPPSPPSPPSGCRHVWIYSYTVKHVGGNVYVYTCDKCPETTRSATVIPKPVCLHAWEFSNRLGPNYTDATCRKCKVRQIQYAGAGVYSVYSVYSVWQLVAVKCFFIETLSQ